MEAAFARLEPQVPPPARIDDGQWVRFRYREQTIHQAIIVKLAAVVSRLRASSVLVQAGFVNEQAVMHRLIDELHDDVLFLVLAVTIDEVTDLHRRFLEDLFAEEFDDPEDIVQSRRIRRIVPRRKIRAYIARICGATDDPHRELEVAETVAKLYSGFVHSAAVFVLDMYGGDPPRYHLNGMQGTPRIDEYIRDSWNYHYRSLLAFRGAAMAFGDAELHQHFVETIAEFEHRSGT